MILPPASAGCLSGRCSATPSSRGFAASAGSGLQGPWRPCCIAAHPPCAISVCAVMLGGRPRGAGAFDRLCKAALRLLCRPCPTRLPRVSCSLGRQGVLHGRDERGRRPVACAYIGSFSATLYGYGSPRRTCARPSLGVRATCLSALRRGRRTAYVYTSTADLTT